MTDIELEQAICDMKEWRTALMQRVCEIDMILRGNGGQEGIKAKLTRIETISLAHEASIRDLTNQVNRATEEIRRLQTNEANYRGQITAYAAAASFVFSVVLFIISKFF